MRYAPPDLAKLDILLVEDDAFQRRLTVQALRTLGCERVTAVEDGVQALDHLARERCALVLSDVHMPRMNGLELLREIRAGRAGVQRDLRVILLTSFSNTEVLGAAMALDVNGFLVKPLRKDLIADRVAMALGERMHLRIGAAYAVVKTELATLQAADETVPPEDEPLPRHALPPHFSRAAKAGVTERQIAADQLEPGMRLTRDVRSRDGHVLIARGQTLTDGNVNRLNDLRSLIDDAGIWVADTPPAVPGGNIGMNGKLGIRPYTRGLHDLGNGAWAWLQPDGSWGWSNAGLVVDGEQTLLVDTLFDLRLTGEMLAAMRRAVPASRRVATVVNTHANGDHCNGNCLLPEAEIVATAAAAGEMAHESPQVMLDFRQAAPALGEMGEFFLHCFGAFEFEGITQRLPTRTFSGALELHVGDKRVQLTQVGPAHTRGDTLVHVPDDAVVYTGDILFIEGHPIMWAGPVANWIAACEHIIALAPQTVVPGHGPITDLRGVRAVRDYLVYIRDQARLRFDAGMPVYEAVLDIALDDYSSWGDAERIVVNVDTLYREFAGSDAPADVAGMFGAMARIRRERAR